MKKILCGAAVAGLIAGTGSVVAPQVGMSATTADWMLAAENVLLIGVDGVNLSKILEYAYDPGNGFRTVMDQGITGAATEVNHTTISGPSWSTVLTGVWDDKHGVINNVFSPEPYNQWPTVFNLIEYFRPEVNTSVIADWDYINGIAAAGGYEVDSNTFIDYDESWANTDGLVTAETIAQILATTSSPEIPNFLFSYQVQVDEAGHEFGGGSAEYAQALMNVSGNIQQIMEAIAQAQAISGDDWTVIVTTDHGHQQSLGFGHGFQSPNETSQFVIFSLAGNEAQAGSQNLNYSIADITPTILQIFGVPLRSDFDGAPMYTDPEITGSLVQPEDLKQALLSALAMYGYPNIGNDLALGLRTVVATIPYLLDGVVTDIDKLLQGIVDQDIFLISDLAAFGQQINDFFGGLSVDALQLVARGVAYLTGSGVIAPTDAPLPPPGIAEFSGLDALLAGDGVPDLGGADLPALLDLDALVA